MAAWFEALTQLQRIFAYIAIPSTVIMLLQALLMLIGIGTGGDADAGGDTDADVDTDAGGSGAEGSDGLGVFTVRGLVGMLSLGGWSGIVFVDCGLHPVLAVLLAIAVGVVTLIGMAYFMKLISRLQSSGNIQVQNAIGKVGRVYLQIPASFGGSGKIHITVQETYTELEAVTADPEPIHTGEPVRVVSTDETGTLVVERLNRDTPDNN